MTNYMQQAQTIFKRDQEEIEWLKKCKHKAYDACCKHIGRRVRVQMLDGSQYEGYLAGSDENHAYLQIASPNVNAQPYRQYPFYPPFYNPYYSTILPLVLFNLLAISLI